jgi:hypothetical protein
METFLILITTMTKKKIFVKIKIPPPYDKEGKEVKGSSCAQLMHL